MRRRRLELLRSRRVGGEEALRQPDAACLQADGGGDAAGAADEQLGRAAADVDEQRVGRERAAPEVTPRKVVSASSSPSSSRVVQP